MSEKDELSTLQKMTLALKKLEKKANSLESDPIAIIGMACRFPGGISTPEEYWNFLLEGKCGISDIPKSRWDNTLYYSEDKSASGKMYVNRGGFIKDDIRKFDPMFFNISPKETSNLDPQHRIALEVCWEALENSGMSAESLMDKEMGVFLGIFKNDYELEMLITEDYLDKIRPYHDSGNSFCTLTGRMSYILGVHGPTMTIDTACSSSLVTTDVACMNLRNKTCDIAITGGVNINISPLGFIGRSKGGMLSKEGYCKTFDASANGYVFSEGCGLVIMKRLSDAIKDKDPIQAVIVGSAVNHGGASSGLMVPNAVAQTKLINKALKNAHLQAQDISYVECHGTGTAIGDPIEYTGLVDAFAGKIDKENPLYLGSVKANLGHLEPVAGIAGLIKVALMLQHNMIPKQILLNTLNPSIDLSLLPAEISKENIPWGNDEEVRYAGVSSFGFGGTNAHVIMRNLSVEERKAIHAEIENPNQGVYTLPISAKDNTALMSLVKQYKTFLETTSFSMEDICYTAGVGRDHFKYRINAWGSKQDIIKALEAFIQNKTDKHLFFCKTKPKNNLDILSEDINTDKFILFMKENAINYEGNSQNLPEILSVLYGNGYDINWNNYYKDKQYNKVILPNYTFNRQDYWFEEHSTTRMPKSWESIESSVSKEETSKYPLLGKQIYSNSFKIGYENTFSLQDFPYLEYHKVYENPVFPGAGFLELLFNATQLSQQSNVKFSNIEIKKGLLLKPNESVRIKTLIGKQGSPENSIVVSSEKVMNDVSSWDEHINAVFLQENKLASTISIEELKKKFTQSINVSDFYEITKNSGIDYGHDFHSIKEMYGANGESFGIVEVSTDINGYYAYPALLDGCFQVMIGSVWDKLNITSKNSTFDVMIPTKIESISLYAPLKNKVYVHVYNVTRNEIYKSLKASIRLYDETGKILLEFENFNCKHIPKEMLLAALNPSEKKQEAVISPQPSVSVSGKDANYDKLLYVENLVKKPLPTESSNTISSYRWLVYSENDSLGSFVGNNLFSNSELLSMDSTNNQTDMEKTISEKIQATKCDSLFMYFDKQKLPESYSENGVNNFFNQSKIFFSTMKSFIKNNVIKNNPFIVVTKGLFQQEKLFNSSMSMILSMIRIISLENTYLKIRMIDFSETFSQEDIIYILKNEINSVATDQIVHYASKTERLVPKMVPRNLPINTVSIKENIPYVITGGMGGIGLSLTEWLISKGAKKIILLGRSDPKEEVINLIRKYENTDVGIFTLKGDVSNYMEVISILADIQLQFGSIAGIYHSAGILRDGVFESMEWKAFEEVLMPKSIGALNLHYALQALNIQLDFMVFFSSITAVMGTGGQTNYGAANGFLDYFANYRTEHNQPTYSINWGPWAEVGMATKLVSMLTRKGYISLKTTEALDVLGKTITNPEKVNIIISQFDWPLVSKNPGLDKNLFPDATAVSQDKIQDIPPSTLQPTIATETSSAITANTDFLKEYISKEVSEKKHFIENTLSHHYRQILELPEDFDVEVDKGFFDSGMDSLMAVDFRNLLQKDIGDSLTLSSTLLFDYGNIEELTGYLHKEFSSLGGKKEDTKPLLKEELTSTQKVTEPKVESSKITYDTKFLQDYFQKNQEDKISFAKNHLITIFRQILELPEDFDVDPDNGFFDSGMDSLMAVDFRNTLQSDLGSSITLSSTLLFDYGTINLLTDYLHKELSGITFDKNLQKETTPTPEKVQEVVKVEIKENKPNIAMPTDFLKHYSTLNEPEKKVFVKNHLISIFKVILELPEDFDVDPDNGFFDSGMDSLMAVDFRNTLQSDLSTVLTLNSTLLFDYGNINLLADYLFSQLEALTPESKDQPYEENKDNEIHEDDLIAQAKKLLGDGNDG